MGMRSRRKGKVGEREVAELLRSFGFRARRGVQFQGGPGSPDVVHDIPGVHIEVKRSESFSPYKALGQARLEAAEGETPVVLHRRNGRQWMAFVPAGFLLSLLQARAAHDLSHAILEGLPGRLRHHVIPTKETDA